MRALFSATLPQRVEDLASSVLQNPLRLTVGPRNAPTATVAQRLLFVGQQEGKMLGLRQLIAEGLTPPVLLFVSSKERAEAVHRCSPAPFHTFVTMQYGELDDNNNNNQNFSSRVSCWVLGSCLLKG